MGDKVDVIKYDCFASEPRVNPVSSFIHLRRFSRFGLARTVWFFCVELLLGVRVGG